jgi:hypothetical protein
MLVQLVNFEKCHSPLRSRLSPTGTLARGTKAVKKMVLDGCSCGKSWIKRSVQDTVFHSYDLTATKDAVGSDIMAAVENWQLKVGNLARRTMFSGILQEQGGSGWLLLLQTNVLTATICFATFLKAGVVNQMIDAINFEEIQACRAIEIILRNEARGTQLQLVGCHGSWYHRERTRGRLRSRWTGLPDSWIA